MDALRAIVYVSTSTMPMTGDALEALLIEACDLNLQTRITGLLVCSETNFMQCFEGSPEAVDITYDRIKKSRRHTDIVELLDEPIVARSFPDWQMGFVRASSSEFLTLSTEGWQKQSGRAGQVSNPSPGLEFLREFWENAR